MGANAAIGVVHWRGLNKLRHVEFDVLWIQKQQARRQLPLRKAPGPRNPSDTTTKIVDQAHIDMYLDMLNLRFDIGRASIEQNLHSVGENIARPKSTSALFLGDLMPLRRCGKPDNANAPVRSAALGCKTAGGVDYSSGLLQTHPVVTLLEG